MRELRVVVVGLWAAAIPFHRVPFGLLEKGFLSRAGLGEWLSPLALLVLLPALADRRRWLALAAPAIVLVGLLPSVACALNTSVAFQQWLILGYTASLVTLGAAASQLGYRRVALGGYVIGAAVSCSLGAIGVALAATGHETELARVEPWLSHLPRPLGFTATPNALALVAAIALVAARELGAPLKSRLAPALVACQFLFMTSIACSMGHVVLAVVPTAAFAWARTATGRKRTAGWSAFALGIVLLVASLRVRLAPLTAHAPFLDLRSTPYAVAHAIAISEFRGHPLAGVGLECFRIAWPAHYDAARFDAAFVGGQESLLGTALDPHSTYLGYLAEAGIAGAAVMTALALLAIRRRTTAAPAFVTLLVFAVLTGLFADLLTYRELAVALGLFAVQPPDVEW